MWRRFMEERMKRILAFVLVLLCSAGAVVQATEDRQVAAELGKIKTLDLKTAQSLALIGNPDMAAAQARIEQARARVSQAVATWWPSLDLTGGGTRQRLSNSSLQSSQALTRALGAGGGGAVDQTSEVYSTNLQATWVLFDGFLRNFRQQQAAYGEQAADAALVDSRRLLATSVAEAFLNSQLSQASIDIARADETFYARQLEDAQNRYKVGAGPWGDVLNIKVQLNSAKNSLIRAQREYEAAGYGLAALLGLAEATFPPHLRLASLDKDTVIAEQKENPETLIKEALAVRPDIRRLEMTVKQAEAATGVAKAPNYPKVQVAGSLDGAREGDARLTGDNFGNTVGMNLSWNLYAGGADKARLIEAEQVKREAVYTLAGLRNSVAAEIRQNLALLAAAEEQVRLQRETVKLVQENRDLAKNEYEAGEASLVRLNEAQRDLNTTHARLAQALVSYGLTQQRLLSATGRNLAGFAPPAKRK
jgi:outer membrane protein TolC